MYGILADLIFLICSTFNLDPMEYGFYIVLIFFNYFHLTLYGAITVYTDTKYFTNYFLEYWIVNTILIIFYFEFWDWPYLILIRIVFILGYIFFFYEKAK